MILIHKRKEFYGHISTCNYYKQLPIKVLKNTDIKIKLPTLYILSYFFITYTYVKISNLLTLRV